MSSGNLLLLLANSLDNSRMLKGSEMHHLRAPGTVHEHRKDQVSRGLLEMRYHIWDGPYRE